ncbi:hypothetical protein QUQ58_004790 [Escherichia coli]|nr:hypothetical protein [Escherichia coli]
MEKQSPDSLAGAYVMKRILHIRSILRILREGILQNTSHHTISGKQSGIHHVTINSQQFYFVLIKCFAGFDNGIS